MNITRLFIERPIMTTLVMVGILLFGIIGYTRLPISDLPNVDFPTIQVSASLPGANPDTMASSVATPLEQQFSTIDGIDSMNSTNSLGSTQITLQFNLSRSIDAAAQDVQAAISSAQRRLPVGMPAPPSLRKVNPADQPIIYLAVSSAYLPLSTVDDYAQTLIAQRISMVNGVAQVTVFGSQKYAVRVQMDPNLLAAKGIGLNEVAEAVAFQNVNKATGALYGTNQNLIVKANGQLTQADQYRPLVVAYRNNGPVRLQDLGTVIDGVENNRVATWYNGTRAIVLAVQRQPGTNTIAVINNIKQLLPTFETVLPPSVKLGIVFDRSKTIQNSVKDVQFTLILTIALVIGVIFLFLRNVSATVIASLALPMSIIGTFAAMAVLGFSLDNLSLVALTLSVGFVVDDAIVMIENITRHIEMGVAPFQAALEGSREIGFTIISMTISLVAVFIPILFMGGLVGRLFNEFAITITVAILVSGFISLSLTPMLCSRFLKVSHNDHPNRLFRWTETGFQKMHDFYDWTLKCSLEHKPAVMLAFAVLLSVTAFLFTITPKGFMPSDDISQIFGSTEGPQGISFTEMVRHQQALAKIVAADENVDGVVSTVENGNTGRIMMRLKPRHERPLSADQLIQKLRPKLGQVPGIRIYLQNPPPIRLSGQVSKSLYQFTMQSPKTEDLYKASQTMEAKMRTIPGMLDVNSDLQIKNPELHVAIDRVKASTLGITADQIEEALSNAYSTRQISTIYAPNNSYQVILELLPQYQKSLQDLSKLYIRSANNTLVPLGAVATLSQGVGPLTVNHAGQFPASTISFNLTPGTALGDKVKDIQRLAAETLPATVRSNFQGSAQAFQSSLQGMGGLLIIAVLVIYIVLGILYESFIHPITILSGLPPAGMGALLTLLIFHKDLDLYGFLGLILLIGIVKKNAIMMIDFALETERNEGKPPEEAIYTAALVRFRPIMMTTLAALAGALPIALGVGEGAESRQSLGLGVFGGLLVSQLLTLYITPVLYIYLDRAAQRFRKPKPAVAIQA